LRDALEARLRLVGAGARLRLTGAGAPMLLID
jgi:hypothetical protein